MFSVKQKNKNSIKLSKPIKIIIATILACVIFLAGFGVGKVLTPNKYKKVNELIRLIQNEGIYLEQDIDLGQPFDDDFLKQYVEIVLSQDKYAKYLSKQELQWEQEQNEGVAYGIGMANFKNTLEVAVIFCGSPAEKAGIRSGDTIIGGKKVGQEAVSFTNSQQLADFCASIEKDEQFEFTYRRGFDGQVLTASLSVIEFKEGYVRYYDSQTAYTFYPSGNEVVYDEYEHNLPLSFDDKTACIEILQFNGDMVKQFAKAIALMQERGRDKIVIDLRNNGGGLVSCLDDLCQYLIYNGGKKNSPLIYAKTKDQKTHVFSTTKNNYLSFLKKTVVLANENTASASEALIGAMLYYGNTDGNFSTDNLILEKNAQGVAKTYGKGIMQNTYTLSDGSGLVLTTALVYQPDQQTCIQDVGITTKPENEVLKADIFLRVNEIMSGN